jgi:hypothetical protein
LFQRQRWRSIITINILTRPQAFFQSYLVSTKKHPLIRRNFDTMEEYYRGEGECRRRRTKIVGCCTLKTAYNQLLQENVTLGEIKLLQEILLNHDVHDGTYKDIPFRGSKKPCHWIVQDPENRKVYFYSRMLGSHRCPD